MSHCKYFVKQKKQNLLASVVNCGVHSFYRNCHAYGKYIVKQNVTDGCFYTHWHGDFINVAKVWRSNKNW